MPDNSANNKLIARNTTFLYIRMFIVLVISLYVTRVVFNSLGVVDFGIYNVVAGFVSLFAFLEATLSGSIQRFYNYLGTKEGEEGFNKVYSAGIKIAAYSAFALFILFETLGIWYINNVMVIPTERLTSANVIFQFVVFSFVLMFVRMPYVGMIMAEEKMDFYAIVYIAEAVLKLGMALALPWLPGDVLVVYGLSMFLISLVVCLMMVIYVKRKFAYLHFSKHQDKDTFKSLLGFSGWSLIGTFAFMLKGEGLNLLLNSFFGPIINAARGIAFQVSNAVNGFSSNISMAFRPQIVNSYAERNTKRTFSLMFRESKICFSLIALLLVPLVLEIKYILRLWLGSDIPEYASIFTILVLLDTLICTLNAPCTQIVYATGRIKSYQIFSTIVNLMLIPVCYLFLKIGYSAISIFIIAIVFSIVNQIVCVIVASRVAGFGLCDYLKAVILPCLSNSFLIILPYLIVRSMNESFVRLILVLLTSFVSAVPILYILVLDEKEREYIKLILSKTFRKTSKIL